MQRESRHPEVSRFAAMPAFVEKPTYQEMPIYRAQHEVMPAYPSAGQQPRTSHRQRVRSAPKTQHTRGPSQFRQPERIRHVRRRFAYGWLAIVATVIAVAIIIPRLDRSTEVIASVSDSEMTTATIAMLESIPIRDKTSMAGYDRTEEFGDAWVDVDNNGCDTRNDTLARDLVAVEKSGPCQVLRGTLVSPYTNGLLDFDQKRDSPSLVRVDHVVSLANSWQTGAPKLTRAQRVFLANDPLNLVVADERSISDKGSADAASWLPSNASLRCAYVTTQVQVKAAYLLWMTQPEHDAVLRELRKCP